MDFLGKIIWNLITATFIKKEEIWQCVLMCSVSYSFNSLQIFQNRFLWEECCPILVLIYDFSDSIRLSGVHVFPKEWKMFDLPEYRMVFYFQSFFPWALVQRGQWCFALLSLSTSTGWLLESRLVMGTLWSKDRVELITLKNCGQTLQEAHTHITIYLIKHSLQMTCSSIT